MQDGFPWITALIGAAPLGWAVHRTAVALYLHRWLREPDFDLMGLSIGLVFSGLMLFPILLLGYACRECHGVPAVGSVAAAVVAPVVAMALLRCETRRHLLSLARRLADQDVGDMRDDQG